MNRKILICFLAALTLLPTATLAQFNYTVNGGTATIVQYTGQGGTVVIPATIDENTVVSIGFGAFAGSTVTNVVIPNTITNIGGSAFSGCYGLTSVNIPNSVTIIRSMTFSECMQLSSITIPGSVTTIENNAFSVCGLTSITIPDSVTNIEDHAFEINPLTSVFIPDSVVSLGRPIFYDCTSLTNISVSQNNPAYSSLNGVLFDKNQTTLIEYPPDLSSIYSVPNGVARIGLEAFADSVILATVVVPASVQIIGDSSFGSCFNLTNITFLGNAPEYGNYSFDRDPVTVYYHTGTSGWFSTYDGLPTVELPGPAQITGNGGIDPGSGNFGFAITATSGQTIVIESSSNLVDWLPLWTNTLSSASTNFIDPQWSDYGSRFYRIHSY